MYSLTAQDMFWDASWEHIEAGLGTSNFKHLTSQSWQVGILDDTVSLDHIGGVVGWDVINQTPADGVLCSPALPLTELCSLAPMCVCMSCVF
jgi:hypothetical protein